MFVLEDKRLVTISITVYSILGNSNNLNRRCGILLTQGYFLPAAAAKWLQSCPTLCDPIDGSPPGSPVPEILQARTLEWVAISFSKEALPKSA